MSFFDGTDREKEREKELVYVVQVHRNRIELHVFPCWRVADQSIRASAELHVYYHTMQSTARG